MNMPPSARLGAFVAVALLLCFLVSCSSSPPTAASMAAAVTAEPTNTPRPTETRAVTARPKPTGTPHATNTAIPTTTPVPPEALTSTPTVEPTVTATETPTPEPTATLTPTYEPTPIPPTPTLEPTLVPPTWTSEPPPPTPIPTEVPQEPGRTPARKTGEILFSGRTVKLCPYEGALSDDTDDQHYPTGVQNLHGHVISTDPESNEITLLGPDLNPISLPINIIYLIDENVDMVSATWSDIAPGDCIVVGDSYFNGVLQTGPFALTGVK